MLTATLASADIAFTGADGALLVVQIVVGLLALGANVFLIVDASRRPDWAHRAAGSQKGLWIGLGVGGLVLCWCCYGLLSAIAPIVWLAAFRTKVLAAEEAGPSQGYGFGGPPPPPPGGYGGPPPPPGGYGGPPPPPGGYGGPPPPPGGHGGPPPPPGGYGAPPGFPPPPGGPPPGGTPPPPPPPPGWSPPPPGGPPPPSGGPS